MSVKGLPFAPIADAAKHRALRLACLTTPYAEVWNRHSVKVGTLPWSQDDPRLAMEIGHNDPSLKTWGRDVGIRSDFARRLALLEIDVLVAKALGLTVDQLVEMYLTQFYVLEENERGTWYDATGRIVWTRSKGLKNAGYRKGNGSKPSEQEWNDILAKTSPGESLECVVEVNFLPSGPKEIRRVFRAPFTICDRVDDYRRAWKFFDAQLNQKAA